MENQTFDNNKDIDIVGNLTFGKDDSLAYLGPDNFLYTERMFKFNKYRDLKCELHHFELEGGKQQMFYPMKKNLPQKPLIDKAYIRITETGILSRMNRIYRPAKPTRVA